MTISVKLFCQVALGECIQVRPKSQHQLGQLPATNGDSCPSLSPFHPWTIHTTQVPAAAFEFWSPQS